MRHVSSFAIIASLIGLALLAGCGGGGRGLPDSNGLVIGANVLPAMQSGEKFDWEIPISGGCGGPYVVAVISGRMPDGVGIDTTDGRHRLTGALLEDGRFQFTIQVTDTGCSPFATTTQVFTWDVSKGRVTIVGTYPPMIPVAVYEDPDKYTDVDAVEKVVYGQFATWGLVVAGGDPPYVASVYDDPGDPADGSLPVGTALPINSLSVVGTPVAVGPNGRPFRLSMRVTDGRGETATIKLQWKIDTPALIFSTAALASGKAGASYSDVIQVVDGVPPFAYELLDDVPSVPDDQFTYVPGNPPSFPSATGFTVALNGKASNKIGPGGGSTATYPSETAVGPYAPFPSEGMYLVEKDPAGGSLVGLPRRAGTFTIRAHVYSAVVPNERGQHAFRELTYTIAPSEPPTTRPAFDVTPGWTVEQAWIGAPNYSTVPEFEIGQGYNPDYATHPDDGLQLVAQGGVPADGYSDAPHLLQRVSNGEIAGTYKWTSDWDADTTGAQPAPAGISSDATGLVKVTDSNLLQRTNRQLVDFGVSDYQLPKALENSATRRLGYSVGPDIVIITYSTKSLAQTISYYSAAERHEWNDTNMKIMKFQAFSSGPQRDALSASDLPATHEVPAAAGLTTNSNPLGALLSGATGGDADVDLLRCVVNATGWWDDVHGLSAQGARPMQHAEPNRGYCYYGQFGYSYSYNGNWQPSVSAVDLPEAANVPGGHAPEDGIYTDGGYLYHFEGADRFGLFILRTDGKIYVPFAYEKDSTIEGFGDGVLETKNNTDRNGILRTVQMTVSPDGRFAAMKLKRDQENLYEHAQYSQILLVSLTGEKVFGETSPGANDGATYKIIDTGVGLTGSGNRIAYASSLALTNDRLYYLIGSQSPSSNSTSTTPLYYQSWSGHFLMRYDVLGNASTAHLMPQAGSDAWWQSSGTPVQSVFHFHGPDYVTTSPGIIESTTSYGRWGYQRYFAYDGMNFQEQNVAPAPFRVSANGKAVAFFAGPNYLGTSSTLIYSNYAFVDYDGSGARRITTSPRHHTMGSARGYTITHGPNEYGVHWGRYTGPTPGVEISDDGLQVAFVYNTYTGSISSSSSYSSASWYQARDNVLLCGTTSGDLWATLGSTTQDEVTSLTFGGSHRWRFGSLAFTKDGTGLVFWGGSPVYQSTYTSYNYNQSYFYCGAYYIHDVTSTNSVVSMCASDEGGSGASEGTTYTSSSPFNPSSTSGQDSRFGVVFPRGGFMSKSRDFLYVTQIGALSSSEATNAKLLGLNVSSFNSGTINGHTNGRAFIPANWPTRRGFVGTYSYSYGGWYAMYYGYGNAHAANSGSHRMARDNGWVFWLSGYQYSGPGTASYSYSGNPYSVYGYGVYGYGGPGVYGFDADVGGPVASLNNPSLFQQNTNIQELSNYLEVSRDGTRLAYVSTTYYYLFYKNQERVTEIHNVSFDATTGALNTSFDPSSDAGLLETSNGRSGEAMAFSTSASDLYYAYKSGAGNETEQELVKAHLDTFSNKWTNKAYSSLSGRMNVLFATR